VNLAIAISLLFGSTTPALVSLTVSVAALPFYFVFSRSSTRSGR
jgi:hypothetical protein